MATEIACEVSAFDLDPLKGMANGTDVPSAGQHPTSIAEHHSFFKLGAFIAERWARLLHSTGIAVTGLVDAIKCIDYGCCIEEEQRMTLTA